jgi:hypothetical protein
MLYELVHVDQGRFIAVAEDKSRAFNVTVLVSATTEHPNPGDAGMVRGVKFGEEIEPVK